LPLQKKRNKEKEAFLYEFFDNEVKNRFQNFASLRTSAPVFKAFDPRANWLLAANSHRLFLNRSPLPQEFFTACGLKIYSGFPRTGQADFAGAENAAGKLPSPTPQTTLFYFGIENRSKLQNRSFNYFFSVKSPIEIIACLQKKPCMNTKSLNQLKPC
jgi:hypothetical protein